MRCRAADDAQLGGDDIQPLAAVFADPVHDAAAARADQAIRLDDFLDARQRRRQVTDGALGSGLGRAVTGFGGAFFLCLLELGQGDGQVLKRQLPFILGQLFRASAMQGMVQFGDQMLLPRSDLLERCYLVQQRLHHRALRGRDHRKVYDRRGLHRLKLSQNSTEIT